LQLCGITRCLGTVTGQQHRRYIIPQAVNTVIPEDGQNYRPKHVGLIGIINKPLLLHLVNCLYYCIGDARSYKHHILVEFSNLSEDLTRLQEFASDMKCALYMVTSILNCLPLENGTDKLSRNVGNQPIPRNIPVERGLH
jgi:hypothetical protein